MNGEPTMAGSLLTLAMVIFAYLLPAIVGSSRGHRNSKAIWALNILLGWTFVGWVGALVWALTDDKKAPVSRPGLE